MERLIMINGRVKSIGWTGNHRAISKPIVEESVEWQFNHFLALAARARSEHDKKVWEEQAQELLDNL